MANGNMEENDLRDYILTYQHLTNESISIYAYSTETLEQVQDALKHYGFDYTDETIKKASEDTYGLPDDTYSLTLFDITKAVEDSEHTKRYRDLKDWLDYRSTTKGKIE